MAFVKAHGLEIAGGGYVKNLVVESFANAAAVTPTEAARAWYNEDTDRWMMSVDNGSGSIIKKTFGNKEEMDAYIALVLSETAGEGSAQVGYDGSGAQTNGLFSIAAGKVDASLDSIAANIDAEMKELDDTQLNYVKRDGSQAFTGNADLDGNKLINLAPGTESTDAVNKAQLDAVQTGLDVKESVRAASTSNLSGTYDNGANTITAGSNAHLTVDDVRMDAGNRLLVMGQTNGYENGIYDVTTAGSAGLAAEVTVVTCVADVSGSLSGRYFLINDPTTEYYVWFDVDNTSTNPSAAGKPLEGTTRTGIEVDIASNATAADVGNALQVKMAAELDFGATDNDAGVVTITNANQGNVTDASNAENDDYDPGFTINVTTQGDDAAAAWVLTRSSDADNQPGAEVTSGKLILAAYISNYVIKNSVNSVNLLF